MLFLLCGGVAAFGVFLYARSAVTNGLDDMAQNIQDNAPRSDPNDPFGQNPGGQQAFAPPDNAPPKDLGEALDWVNNGQTKDKKNAAADWLAKAAVEEPRQKEVAAALEKLMPNPNTHAAGLRGLANWAGPEDVPTLVKAVDTDRDLWLWGKAGMEAGDALVRLQDERAAPVFARRLTEGGERANAAKRLGQLGQVAEKEVLKYMDHPDQNIRSEVEQLLRGYGTKDDLMFSQALADLRNPDPGYHKGACEYLIKAPVNEARRDEVSKALNLPLADSNGETRDTAAKVLKVWATKANVPGLIALLESDPPFHPHFVVAMEALATVNDEKGAEAVAKYLADPFKHEEAARGLRAMGPLGVKGVVNNLESREPNLRKAACEFLAKQKEADETCQKQAARALDKLLDDTTDVFGGVRQEAAKAEVVWGDKESVPALAKGMLKKNSDVWQPCLEALTRIKDNRAVIPMLTLMTLMPEHLNDVDKAFEAMGSGVVEPVFDNLLNDPNTPLITRHDLCLLLSKYGTKASLPALQIAVKSNNPVVKAAANQTIAAINAKP